MVKSNVTESNLVEGAVIRNKRGDLYTVLAITGQVVALGDKNGYFTKWRTIKALVENKYYMQFTVSGEVELVGGLFGRARTMVEVRPATDCDED